MQRLQSLVVKIDGSEGAGPFVGAKQVLLLSAWFGLVTGFGELLLLGVKKFALGRIILLGPQAFWMTPLANVLLLSTAAVGLSTAALLLRKSIRLDVATLIFTFLGFLSLILMYSLLHTWAAIALAAGLAMQTSRMLAAKQAAFLALVERTVGWMFAIVATGAAILMILNP